MITFSIRSVVTPPSATVNTQISNKTRKLCGWWPLAPRRRRHFCASTQLLLISVISHRETLLRFVSSAIMFSERTVQRISGALSLSDIRSSPGSSALYYSFARSELTGTTFRHKRTVERERQWEVADGNYAARVWTVKKRDAGTSLLHCYALSATAVNRQAKSNDRGGMRKQSEDCT
jgi:hypothetical protein